MRARILFLATTPAVSRAIAAMLESNDFYVTRSDAAPEAARLLAAEQFDLLAVEVKASPRHDGLRFLRHVHGTAPHFTPRIVVISGDPSENVRRELDNIGICDVVLKPVHEDEILAAVIECLDRTSATVH